MGRDADSWTTIESDPGVFTELMQKIGVQGVQVEEIWSLDKESLLQLSPVYGLVFLFKWVKDPAPRECATDTESSVFFAQQVIPNACATQAILSILLNIPPGTPGVDLGTELKSFREFTSELPSDMKGLAISNSDRIRSVHNSMSRPESLLPDEDETKPKDGEAFHFISYLPVNGALYELDGLQQGPIRLATNVNTEAEWLEAVIPHISSRMERYQAGEVRFNLMALIADRRAVLEQQIMSTRAERESVLGGSGGAADPTLTAHLDSHISSLEEQLAAEHAKRAAWADENIRRRHSYIPLMFNLLKAAAASGQLGPLIQAAKEPSKKQQQRQQQQKAAS